MFYPSHSIRSMKEVELFLKFNFQHPLIPKFIVYSCSIFHPRTAMTSEVRERKTSLPGVVVMARQPKGGQSAYILGPHSLQTTTNIQFYRTHLYFHRVVFFEGGRKWYNIRLRKNDMEALESHFSAAFESF